MKTIVLLFLLSFTNKITTQNIEKLYYSEKNDFSVLVFTKTNGFVHGKAIEAGINLITKIGKEKKFNVDHTNNSKHINKKNIIKYKSVIFLNTTLDVFNNEEQNIFKKYIQDGGGFVGVHSATDTEYNWEWYGKLVGAYFKSHPKVQKAKIQTIKKNHISTSHLNNEWEIEDEWYNYNNINPNIIVLLNLDEASYKGGENGKKHPITWYHNYDGGKSFYTGLGHNPEVYSDERFIKLLTGGILYASKH